VRKSTLTVIYQITDTHVPLEEDHIASINFQILMDFVRQNPADLLVISGDLPGEDGSEEVYRWMKNQIPTSQDTSVIPGNHDDPDSMYSIFGDDMCGNREFLFTRKLDQIDVLFTNTGSTVFPDDHLGYIRNPSVREGSILFTHFPTQKVSSGFMDLNYPLGNITEAHTTILKSNISHVFCGHFHTEHKVQGSYDLHLTPSPAFTVDLHSSEIVLGKPRVPIRKIEITGKDVTSSIIYIDD